VAAANFSPVKGHWSTPTGSVESQVIWAACLKGEYLVCWTRAPTENAVQPDILTPRFLVSLKVVQDVTCLVDIFPIPKGIVALLKHLVRDHAIRTTEYSYHTL
jgi:hypothetical protein